MKRGDLVIVSLPGDFGKPRPGLIIQAERFDELPTATLLPLSGTLVEAPLIRVTVEPSESNGLRKTSQIMIDKAITVRRDKLGGPFGRLDDMSMLEVNRLIASFLGFG